MTNTITKLGTLALLVTIFAGISRGECRHIAYSPGPAVAKPVAPAPVKSTQDAKASMS